MKKTLKENMKKRFARVLGNESGVTLIELLAVVVILAIIAAVAVPAVMKNFSTSKNNTDAQNEQIIVDAIQRAVMDQASTSSNSVTGITTSNGTSVLSTNNTIDITSDGKLTLFGTFGTASLQPVSLIGDYLNQMPKSQSGAGLQKTTFNIGTHSYSISESSTDGQWTITAIN